MKLGEGVIFIHNDKTFAANNNQSIIAPATIVAAWGGGESALNLKIQRDSSATASDNYSSVTHASSLEHALSGTYCWAKKEEIEEWGVNLSDYYSMYNILKEREAKAKEQPVSESSAETKEAPAEQAQDQESTKEGTEASDQA